MKPIASTGMAESVDFRSLEAELQRQPVEPGVAARPAHDHRCRRRAADDGARALADQQHADDAQQRDVGQADHEIELIERAQPREQRDTADGADDAAGEQHQRQRDIERVAPPIGDRAGERGGRHVGGDARHRHRRLHADEDQQRRHQKSAADTEHAGNEANREPHREHEENIDGNVGDRKDRSPRIRLPALATRLDRSTRAMLRGIPSTADRRADLIERGTRLAIRSVDLGGVRRGALGACVRLRLGRRRAVPGHVPGAFDRDRIRGCGSGVHFSAAARAISSEC